ncbi:phosphoribosylformylglycinamidine synthase subunit PurL, partial [bacterium]|nr:phosphoribosylformylglycinamidine synthase subunit PurL [bacterium]
MQTINEPTDYVVVARQLISQPNIASKRWVYEQYDSMVGTANMGTNKCSDAAVVNIKGTSSALVLSVDCNGRYVHANPKVGTMIAVCEAARNIV